MPDWFARPDTVTLPLPSGATLTVKRRLNSADARRLRAMEQLPTMAEPGKVMAYLVDWTVPDNEGHRVVIVGAPALTLAHALDNLDEDRFDEIYAVVSAHVEAMKAEREQEKNDPATERPASVISPSPSAPAGALSGSVN